MELLFLVFLATYAGVLAYAVASLVKAEKTGLEQPSAFVKYSRHSAAKLRVFGRVLRMTLANTTTVLIVLCLMVSSLIAAAAYSERRAEFVQSIDEPVREPLVLVKMSAAMRMRDVLSTLGPLIERSESATYLYRVTLERGTSVEGLPGIKWVFIGVEGGLLSELGISKGELLTGCETLQPQVQLPLGPRVRCAQGRLRELRAAPLETLLPVLGYIGTEPITPSLDLVVVSDIDTIVKILGLEEPLVTDVLLVGVELERDTVEKLPELLNADALHYYRGTAVLIVGSARIITREAATSMLLVTFSCATIAAAAYRSLLPEFRAVHERLHYVGLPLWGTTITLLTHVAVSVSLGTTASLVLASHFLSVRQALASASVSLLSGFLAALTLTRGLGAETTRYGSYTPVFERHELVIPAGAVGDLNELVKIVREAIASNEFFELEEFEYKRWENEVVVYCRASFREMWGVFLSGLISITCSKDIVRLFIETSVSSVEELSERVNESVRSLFVSRLFGRLRVLVRE